MPVYAAALLGRDDVCMVCCMQLSQKPTAERFVYVGALLAAALPAARRFCRAARLHGRGAAGDAAGGAVGRSGRGRHAGRSGRADRRLADLPWPTGMLNC
eukprot:98566-Chlamydomonas_euryale.AAC.6